MPRHGRILDADSGRAPGGPAHARAGDHGAEPAPVPCPRCLRAVVAGLRVLQPACVWLSVSALPLG